jgi:hypothetical protein
MGTDLDEFQYIGTVTIDGGGSKTFGTSGSKIGWLPGASVTFNAVSTVTVGVKKAASIDKTTGPPARATVGKAAFDVYKDLVGGTDTVTSTTWREDAMASGTPFTVTDGDEIAICVFLSKTSGTTSMRIRNLAVSTGAGYPTATLVTASQATFTAQTILSNLLLIFDDGTLGWISPSMIFSVIDTASASIGNGNIFGNIFQVPFPCKIDALAATVTPTAGSDFALELYSTPLGTPSLVESIAIDQNATASTALRLFSKRLTTPRTLAINTDYCIGVKQTTATNLTINQRDVSNATYFKPQGMGSECYAATSTGGATFAAINSGKRRYNVWARISALDDGVQLGGMLRNPGVNGGLIG